MNCSDPDLIFDIFSKLSYMFWIDSPGTPLQVSGAVTWLTVYRALSHYECRLCWAEVSSSGVGPVTQNHEKLPGGFFEHCWMINYTILSEFFMYFELHNIPSLHSWGLFTSIVLLTSYSVLNIASWNESKHLTSSFYECRDIFTV